ncbi:hypothetical protein IMG5_091390 [Ichthyophthirius multifiliis]|uniref:Uncharacterized protein n=1 Tax=Ichthyophthirius multifiliis TaxID=5932 RepID=G0QRC0_ICHMU|nr:hypothetical protein IMG5_091390 [Ichthyophthirius multifiliis]EGR32234.1 hypothetical protein IMG5_091390 [Ichthyophthirius multifiliis]|eukprot:XP_004035720.1 hypothetical protein IMG5_091390 [Ichthyophthirius multifiliis]
MIKQPLYQIQVLIMQLIKMMKILKKKQAKLCQMNKLVYFMMQQVEEFFHLLFLNIQFLKEKWLYMANFLIQKFKIQTLLNLFLSKNIFKVFGLVDGLNKKAMSFQKVKQKNLLRTKLQEYLKQEFNKQFL